MTLVPTAETVLSNLCKSVDEMCMCYDYDTIAVTVDKVKKAVRTLEAGKKDGYAGLESDHLINGSELLFDKLCQLINLCFRHSYMPECLQASTIVSIPKDYKCSLNTSDNYRGICLCSSIQKVMDILMLGDSNGSLQTSDLQFAYKAGHSTTTCTTMVKEVAQYYRNNGSDVFLCLLDASKAFDRIKYETLFQTLIDRKFPAPYIRLLMDNYINQDIRIKWGDTLSEPFKGSNGVRQGGVISPILFTVYMDKLVDILQDSNAGCWLGDKYFGVFIYADDIVLASPSLTGLQRMVDICDQFGKENSIAFNDKKSMCLCISDKIDGAHLDICLNGKSLVWNEKAKHVGNVINRWLTDEDDITVKTHVFYQQINRLLADYQGIRYDILSELFNKNCGSFYGSQCWDLRSKGMQSLYTSWNRGVRRLLRLPFDSHRYILPAILNTQSLHVQIVRRFCKMVRSMYNSKNGHMKFLLLHRLQNSDSIIKRNLFYIKDKFGVDSITILHGNFNDIHDVLNEEQNRLVAQVRELLDVRDGVQQLQGFGPEMVTNIINFISSH